MEGVQGALGNVLPDEAHAAVGIVGGILGALGGGGGRRRGGRRRRRR